MNTHKNTSLSPSELHKEHRKRMMSSFLSGSNEVYYDHQLLELLIMQVILRRDVNPEAHSLLINHGTLSGVFRADKTELMKVHGVKHKTAEAIHATGMFIDYLIDTEHNEIDIHFKSSDEIDLFCAQYAAENESEFFCLFTDKRLKLLDIENFNMSGSMKSINQNIWRALNHNALMALICCHVKYGEMDVGRICEFTDILYKKLRAWQFSVMDLMIIEDIKEDRDTRSVNIYRPLTSLRNLPDKRIFELAIMNTRPVTLTYYKE